MRQSFHSALSGLAFFCLIATQAFGQATSLPPNYFLGSPSSVSGFLSPRLLTLSDLPAFTFPATGAVARSLSSKSSETLSVVDFGAIGGGADDHTALQTALTWACNNQGTLIVPGVFNTSVPLVDCGSGLSNGYAIRGVQDLLGQTGARKAKINYTGGAASAIITIGVAAPGVSYEVIIENLIFNGNANVTDGIHALTTGHSIFRNISVSNVTTACFHFNNAIADEFDKIVCSTNENGGMTTTPTTGLLFDRSAGGALAGGISNLITDSIMEGLSGCGIALNGTSSSNTIIAGTSEANGTGICIDSTSNNNNILGVDLEANTTADVTISGANNVIDNSGFQSVGKTSTIGGARNTIANQVVGLVSDIGTNNIYNNIYLSVAVVSQGGVGTRFQNIWSGFGGNASFIGYNDTSTAPWVIQGSVTTGKAFLNTSAVPAVTACGTAPAVTAASNNQGGVVTSGTANTSCTVTYANAYPTASFPTITPLSAATVGSWISAFSASAFTVTFPGSIAGAVFSYNVQGK